RGLLLRGMLGGLLLRGLLLRSLLLRGLLLRGLLLGTTGVVAVEVTGSAGLGTANRPGTDALSIEHVLGNSDLLGARRVGRVALAAVRVPGLRAELQAAVVTVAGVGAPVAAALTLTDSVPVHAAGLCGDRGQRQRSAQRGARDGDASDVSGSGGSLAVFASVRHCRSFSRLRTPLEFRSRKSGDRTCHRHDHSVVLGWAHGYPLTFPLPIHAGTPLQVPARRFSFARGITPGFRRAGFGAPESRSCVGRSGPTTANSTEETP